jgi:hypothetical protein
MIFSRGTQAAEQSSTKLRKLLHKTLKKKKPVILLKILLNMACPMHAKYELLKLKFDSTGFFFLNPYPVAAPCTASYARGIPLALLLPSIRFSQTSVPTQ